MFEIYERSVLPKTESSMPFKTFIDDICYKKIKKVNIFTFGKKEVKERSYTYTPSDVPLENWRNRKSIDSTITLNNNLNSNGNCKNLQKNKMEFTRKLKLNN